MTIIHFCVGLDYWNGMANTARQFVEEERAGGDVSRLINDINEVSGRIDRVVIHGAWLPVLWKVAVKAKTLGAQLVIRPSGSYDPVRLAYHGWKKRLVGLFERRMLRRADVVWATCDAEIKWIRSYEPRIKQIKEIDLKRFFDLSRVEHVERVGAMPLHLLYLGRRHPLKGLEYLEDAVRQLQNSTRPTCSVLLKIISSAFGEKKEMYWKWCDVLVLPTLSENFGRVVAEALERGKRVITTDGAPAWGDGNDYGGRLTYIRGYRDGSAEDRVRFLKEAIVSLTNSER